MAKPIIQFNLEFVDMCRRINAAYVAAFVELGRRFAEARRLVRAQRLAEIQAARADGTFRRAEDLRQIRRIADRERRIARAHLDHRMDLMYADLGLERDQ